MISVDLANSKEFGCKNMAGKSEDIAGKILVVTENPGECQGVIDGLENREINYEILSNGGEARRILESGEFSAVYLPDLSVGVNGSCSKTNYLPIFFNSLFPEVDSEERISVNEGLSVLIAAEKKKIPAFHSDEFNYCMNPMEGIEFILPQRSEKIVNALVDGTVHWD
jgi:hypothetical protein